MSDSFDMEGYQKTLERLVVMSEKEYYTQIVDINRHQVSVARILAWLAVVLIGFDIALFDWSYARVGQQPEFMPTLTWCYLMFTLAFLSAGFAFVAAIMAIPALGDYAILYDKSWSEYAEKAYDSVQTQSRVVYETTLNDLLGKLDSACFQGATTNGKRGRYLRLSSCAVMITLVFIIIGFLTFSFNYYL